MGQHFRITLTMKHLRTFGLAATVLVCLELVHFGGSSANAAVANLKRKSKVRQKQARITLKTDRLIAGDKKQNKLSNIFLKRNISKTDSGQKTLNSPTKLNSLAPIAPQKLIASGFQGQASWYGNEFQGRPTANGETFNQYDLTAAHPSLPFGTKVKVTNLNNGRSVVVRINDRGPYAEGRIIDVSAAAASAIDMMGSGVAPVQLEVLGQ
jgi:rare lipoprotein A